MKQSLAFIGVKRQKDISCMFLLFFGLLLSIGFAAESSQEINQYPSQSQNKMKDVSKMVRPINQEASYRNKAFPSFLTCKQKLKRSTVICDLVGSSSCKNFEPAEVLDDFWVIAPIYSYSQKDWQYLYYLHENFKNYIKSFGIPFCTIEAIKKDLNQNYLVTQPNNEPYDIQVQYYDFIYMRENLVNVALKKIPQNWQYVAWIDAHQVFSYAYWWEESIVEAEKFSVLQNYRTSDRMNVRNQTMRVKPSVQRVSTLSTDLEKDNIFVEYGNSYVLRRDVYDKIGSILDTCIASRCDLSYILASITPEKTYFSLLYRGSRQYSPQLEPWINNTRPIFNNSRAIVRGNTAHFEHGRIVSYYDLVKDKLEEGGFNIKEDLDRDENGTLFLKNDKIRAAIVKIPQQLVYDGGK